MIEFGGDEQQIGLAGIIQLMFHSSQFIPICPVPCTGSWLKLLVSVAAVVSNSTVLYPSVIPPHDAVLQ